MKSCRGLLVQVSNIIEATYPHDKEGNRLEGDSPISGSDVVDMLGELEEDVFQTIKD